MFTGGTGGHLYPAIAIADSLRTRREHYVYWNSRPHGSAIVPKAGYPLVTVSSRPMSRKPLEVLKTTYANAIGTVQAIKVRPLETRHRDCNRRIRVLSGCLVARLLRVRAIALLEPNARVH